MTGPNLLFDFSDKVLLLTGATGGIGREVAKLFHAAGASLVLGGHDSATLESFARSLSPTLDRIAVAELNAGNPDSVQCFVNFAQESFGRVDVVVPSAGIYPEILVEAMTDNQWRQVMSTNLDGVFFLVRRVLPLMPAGSSIVNIASVAGHRGSHSHAHYAASKAGIISFTRTLAMELGPKQIRANAVSPGVIETPMSRDFLSNRADAVLSTTPLRRWGQPSEVASVIGFLASDAANFVNGEIIHVNGGMFMAG